MVKALISPSKYVQGYGIWNNINEYLPEDTKDLFLLVDGFMINKVEEKIGKNLKENKINYHIEKFSGESSQEEIDRVMILIKEKKSNTIVGVGGGKTLDTARTVGHFQKLSTIILPTIAATDSPTSSSSVVYTKDGQFSEYVFCDKNPDAVLVDTEIVASAPVRFLVAGMGDALATYFEARACYKAQATVGSGAKPTISAMTLAKACYDQLMEDGVKAKIALQNHVVTKAVENIIETNIYLSGIGFESGGLAAAHAIHNGLTVLDQVHGMYHGEKVAFGTIVQLVLENANKDEIDKVLEFCNEVGLPTTLKDLGVENIDNELLMKVSQASCSDKDTMQNMPFEVTPQEVFSAILTANSMGINYKNI